MMMEANTWALKGVVEVDLVIAFLIWRHKDGVDASMMFVFLLCCVDFEFMVLWYLYLKKFRRIDIKELEAARDKLG